jgi:hypothetical protein
LATGHSARVFELLDGKTYLSRLKLLRWALGLNILNPYCIQCTVIIAGAFDGCSLHGGFVLG